MLSYNNDMNDVIRPRPYYAARKYGPSATGLSLGEWSFFSVEGGREERVDWNMSAISCATKVRQMRGAFNGKTYLCRKQDGILPDYL